MTVPVTKETEIIHASTIGEKENQSFSVCSPCILDRLLFFHNWNSVKLFHVYLSYDERSFGRFDIPPSVATMFSQQIYNRANRLTNFS